MALQPEEADGVDQSAPVRPKLSQRKSSFSEALTKFTTNTFNYHRTTSVHPFPPSLDSTGNHTSRIPTPSRIPRSTSFFSNLKTFSSNPPPSSANENESCQTVLTKRSRKVSDRLAQTPFFSNQQQRESPFSATPRARRESSVKIEQRGLMQPVHPPLPRSSTMGNVGQQSSPHTPGFMRATSSSARRSSATLQRQRTTPMPTNAERKSPTKTPTNGHQATPHKYPARTDSLLPRRVMGGGPVGEGGPADLEEETSTPTPTPIQPTIPAPIDYSEGENFKVTAEQDPAHQVHAQHLQAPSGAKPSKKGILKSKTKTRKLSEALSNLYEDDDVEANSPIVIAKETQNAPEAADRPATPAADDAEEGNIHLVHKYETPIYWLGRYTALSDRFRTCALPSPPSSPSTSHSPSAASTHSTSTAGPNHAMHDTERRDRRVYVHLRSLCQNDEARASLDNFREVMSAREKRMAGKGGGEKVKDKKGWLEGLMGKKK